MKYGDLSGLATDSVLDVDALRERLRNMSDTQLISFGREMHALVYPLSYGFDGKPTVSAFSIQLDEARAEWRRRQPSQTAECSEKVL
jgi:hypothetical protein